MKNAVPPVCAMWPYCILDTLSLPTLLPPHLVSGPQITIRLTHIRVKYVLCNCSEKGVMYQRLRLNCLSFPWFSHAGGRAHLYCALSTSHLPGQSCLPALNMLIAPQPPRPTSSSPSQSRLPASVPGPAYSTFAILLLSLPLWSMDV